MKTWPIRRIVRHRHDIISFSFERSFDAYPGQFVGLWLPGVDEKPISISNLTVDELELTVKAVGPFTRRLLEVQEGDRLGIRGPFGRGFSFVPDTLLIGGGMGIAPLRFLAERLRRAELPHTLLFGVRTAAELMFRETCENHPDAFLTAEDGSLQLSGRVSDHFEKILDHRVVRRLAAAGPEPMLLAVRELGRRFGLPVELSFERYMKCGIGLCGQCCMDGSGIRVCIEGPVLTEAELSQVTELGLPHRNAAGKR
jgi:dihydroorotate dehydrogenase electron transfer subunit